jgi:hypothetical protein
VDLKKAFDTVDHQILIDKINHYGVVNASLGWYESYLEGRTQFTCINNATSHKTGELQISGLLGEWKEIGTESRREMGLL